MKNESATELQLAPKTSHRELSNQISQIWTDNTQHLLELALKDKAAVEIVKELRAMREQDRAFAAKQSFDAAMKAFQADCPVIVKSKGVSDNSGKEAYRFAPVEDVERVIRPICQKHGFSHKFPKMILGEGTVTVFCEVKHDAGHSEVTEASYRIGTQTRMMSNTQVDAATETFAKRRALCNAYGLVLAGEDKDGVGNTPKPAAPKSDQTDEVRKLAKELWDLLAPVRGPERNWNAANQWLYANDILDGALDPLPQAPYLDAATLRAIISKSKQQLQAK